MKNENISYWRKVPGRGKRISMFQRGKIFALEFGVDMKKYIALGGEVVWKMPSWDDDAYIDPSFLFKSFNDLRSPSTKKAILWNHLCYSIIIWFREVCALTVSPEEELPFVHWRVVNELPVPNCQLVILSVPELFKSSGRSARRSALIFHIHISQIQIRTLRVPLSYTVFW